MPSSSKVCPVHKKEFNLFSDTREELICEDCALAPAHSRYPAKVVKTDEAFRVRLSGLYNVLNNYVLPKQTQISAQKARVETCLAAVKAKKAEIEKDMKGEFSAMNERLNFSFGSKQAVLQHELKELQLDLDRINHIVMIVESSASDQVSFLQRSSDLKSLIDLSLSKPFKVRVDVDSSDMPKELSKVREIVSDYSAIKNLIQLKDELIWKLLHEKPNPKELNEATSRELAEWARLAEKYSQELKRFQVSCEYCNSPLNEETVNSNCGKNLKSESRGRLAGTGRHFFSDNPKRSVRSSSPATKENEISIKDLARLIKQKMIPLHKIFLQEDPNRTGYVKIKDFVDITQNLFEISKPQASELASKFDKKKTGQVLYEKMVRMVCEENILDSKKEILAYFREIDLEFDGVVSVNEFLNGLAKFGAVLEGLKVLKQVEVDESGNVEYLVFINDVVKRNR
jgi:Ca2+-binding EF-hand superfamily protein